MASKKQQKANRRRKFVNAVGAFAYINVAIQWVMAVAIFIPLISESPLLNPEPAAPKTPVDPAAVGPSEPTIFTFIGVTLVLLIALSLTAYALAKMPISLARTGRKVVQKSSMTLTTAVIKASGKRDSKKLRDAMTPKLVLLMKATILLLPIAIAFLSRYTPEPLMNEYLSLYLAVLLANWSFMLFVIQYGFAYTLGVKRTDIW